MIYKTVRIICLYSGVNFVSSSISNKASCESISFYRTTPSRQEELKHLKAGKEFDILIIGGGATGAGAALDAAARGLKVACVEREDFSSGTSSRSTKLIWAGSRYLVNAFVSLFSSDLRLLTSPVQTLSKFYSEVKMVMNCHRERRFLLLTQPHLVHWLPIAVPVSQWILWPPPFGFYPAALGPIGLFPAFFFVYDMMSGFSSPPSHIMTHFRAQRKYPQLADHIKYCSVFYEGQHDDARTNLAIAVTAAQYGASIANYCTVVEFLKASGSNKVVGAIVRDELTGEKFTVKAKTICLSGGPFTDELRQMEDKDGKKAIRGASGIHIVLPSYYAPDGMGLVDMSTSDGRFLFLLPWQGHVVVGTTDSPCSNISMQPVPPEKEIQWLLKECSKYLHPELKVRREDVLSAWSGIRPLAIDPHADSTAAVSRDHVISHNPDSGVIFISGGKWTTYREMAEDLIDKAIAVGNLKSSTREIKSCSTLSIALNGRDGYTSNLPIRLSQEFGLEFKVAEHLSSAYGGHAAEVCRIAKADPKKALGEFLLPGHPYIKAEVVYAIRNEWACRADDIIARRTRLAFLNKTDAVKAIPIVVAIMGDELRWSAARRAEEVSRCTEYLKQFGGPSPLPS